MNLNKEHYEFYALLFAFNALLWLKCDEIIQTIFNKRGF